MPFFSWNAYRFPKKMANLQNRASDHIDKSEKRMCINYPITKLTTT